MYTVSKEMTATAIKAEVKAAMTEFIMTTLKEKYGDENVRMVRTGGTSKSNDIAVIVDEATGTDGEVNPIVVVLNPSVKEFSNHTSDKGKVYVPFDFYAAAEAYDTYLTEKAEKAAAAKASKKSKKKDEE